MYAALREDRLEVPAQSFALSEPKIGVSKLF